MVIKLTQLRTHGLETQWAFPTCSLLLTFRLSAENCLNVLFPGPSPQNRTAPQKEHRWASSCTVEWASELIMTGSRVGERMPAITWRYPTEIQCSISLREKINNASSYNAPPQDNWSWSCALLQVSLYKNQSKSMHSLKAFSKVVFFLPLSSWWCCHFLCLISQNRSKR